MLEQGQGIQRDTSFFLKSAVTTRISCQSRLNKEIHLHLTFFYAVDGGSA